MLGKTEAAKYLKRHPLKCLKIRLQILKRSRNMKKSVA